VSAMDEGALFGELRSLFQHEPSAQLWRELCALADAWSDEGFVQVALEYALNHLRGWPDALRAMPAAWSDALARGDDEPRALLCAVLAPPRASLEPDALLRLCASPRLTHITTLDLGGWGLADEHIARIVASPHLSNLTTLELGQNHIGPDGAQAIAASPHMGRLSALYLVQCHTGPEGALALARSPHMRQLTALNVRQNKLGDAGVAALSQLHLEELYAGHNEIGDVGLAALCAADRLRGMHTLVLDRNAITSEGVAALLAPGSTLRGLDVLDLCANDIHDDGMCALAAAPQLGRLDALRVQGNPFGDKGMLALASSPHLALSIRAAWMDHQLRGMMTDLLVLRDELESGLRPVEEGEYGQRWSELRQNLALWPLDALTQTAIPLVLEHCAHWPVGVRAPASGWIDTSGQGAHHPCLALCDHLWLDADLLPADAEWYAELFASPLLANIRSFESARGHGPMYPALAASPLAGRLSQLVDYFDGDHVAAVIARSPSFHGLKVLRLELSVVGAALLADAPHLASLEQLRLIMPIEYRDASFDEGAVLAALLTSPHLSASARAPLQQLLDEVSPKV
jgi:hypothetical protein